MAIITMPPTLALGEGSRIEQITADAVTSSDPTGSTQARTYGAPRWALSLVQPTALLEAQAQQWKAVAMGLRGSINHLAAFDPSRPMPLGTLRGSPTLVASAAAGATSLQITAGAGQAGKTLTPGDWVQIGTGLGTSQLVLCLSAAVADGAGALTIIIEPPLRQAFSAGAVITLVRASAYFLRPAGRAGWGSPSPGITNGFAIDLVEAW